MQVNNVNGALVKMARVYELALGKFGDHHLTVSEAMRQNLMTIIPRLRQRSGTVHVLYDRATSKFQDALSMQEKSALLERLHIQGIIGQEEG